MKRTAENWKQITKDNKMLAEFLGYAYIPLNKNSNTAPGWRKPGATLSKLGTGIGYPYLCRKHRDLVFHCDWNWLMTVVEEITKLGVCIKTFGNGMCGFKNMPVHMDDNLIDATYTACVVAVKKLTMEKLATFEYKGTVLETYYNGTNNLPNKLYVGGELILEDSSFKPAPSYFIDDPEAMVALLGFYVSMEEHPVWREWLVDNAEIETMVSDFDMRDDEGFLAVNELTYEYCSRIEQYITTH